MPRLKIHREDTFKGYEIIDEYRRVSTKKNVREFYTKCLEAIYNLGQHAIATMSRPEAFMYTFCFTDDHKDFKISEVIERINDVYNVPKKRRKEKNTFKPLIYWCRELSTNKEHAYKDHVHYHLLCIVDKSKGRIGAARFIIKRLRKQGIIKTASISKDADKSKNYTYQGKSLKDYAIVNLKSEFPRYMYWFAYLAKVETRHLEGGRSWGCSNITS